MATPVWQPAKLYSPGALVQPATAVPPVVTSLDNAGFDDGTLTGWTFANVGGSAAASVTTLNSHGGTYNLAYDGGNGSGSEGGIELIGQNTEYPAATPGLTVVASIQVRLSSSGVAAGRVRLFWYTAGDVLISVSDGNLVQKPASRSERWVQSTVTGIAPATTAKVKVGFWGNANGSGDVRFDSLTWNYTSASAPAGLIYKAVQAAVGTSDTDEPVWPSTLGVQVVDNTVTWEAVLANRVVWEASPIMVSGATEPTWPTTVGERITDGTISWEVISRRVEDEKCPNSKVVTIVASKVFAADGDIVRFCASANPLDWSTPEDAGYLPTGLQQANANDMAVLNQYRSNVVAFNASSFQNWQADPDPAAMAILDQMDGIGSSWQHAAQPVGNELFYLSQLGVRTVGIAAGAENLMAGDVGMPIDPLVREAMAAEPNGRPVATYYPGAGQYWLAMRAPLPTIVGPTITGSAPDGIEGVAYTGFSYTVTPGDGAIVLVEVSEGLLPPTVSMDGAGVLDTAVTTTAGDYAYDVYALDTNGLSFTHPDSVTVLNALGNYWNPADTDPDITLSNANRTATSSTTGGSYQKARGFGAKSTGKWYFEVQGTFHPDNYDNGRVGVDPVSAPLANAVGGAAGSYGIQSNGYRQEGGVFNSTQMAAPLPGSNVIQVAWDADAGNLWYGVNDVWAFSGDPAAGTNPSSTGVTGSKLPAAHMVDGGLTFNYTISTTPAQCAYTPPSGFSRWYP